MHTLTNPCISTTLFSYLRIPFLLLHKAMSTSFNASLQDVVIASGATTSRAVFSDYEYSDARYITIQSPATLDALTFTIEVSQDATTWATLATLSADLAVPAAGKAIQYIEMLSSKYFRIKASGAVAANRTFKVSKQWVSP